MIAPGTVLFDKYRVDREIGKGGMARVYSATHLHLQEQVAIKTLLPELAQNPGVVHRFLREARAVVRLKGEHVARVQDVGTLPWGAPYIVMELLAGLDLAELLKQRGRLGPGEAVDCVLQVCEALAEAHAAGIVHRDIKPSNLFITRRPDGSPLIKVLDFGISKVGFEEQVNLTLDSMVGTPSYMSPEQLRGSAHVDARTDIWSLGVVLYRLLEGIRPFQADTVSALAIQAATEPTPVLTTPLPAGLDAIAYRCLEKDPALRFQTVAELAFAIAPYAADARAASIVIERTQGIQRWTPPQLPPPPLPPPPQAGIAMPAQPRMPGAPQPVDPTTLGSSAGSIQTRAPGRRLGWLAMLGGAAVIGTAIAIAVGATGGAAPESTQPAAAPASTTTATPIEPSQIAPSEPAAPAEPAPAPAAASDQATGAPQPAKDETKTNDAQTDKTKTDDAQANETTDASETVGKATPTKTTRTKRTNKRTTTKTSPPPPKPAETKPPEPPPPPPKPPKPAGNPLDTRT